MDLLLMVCLSLSAGGLTDEGPSAHAAAAKDLGHVRFGVRPDANIASLIRRLRDPDPYERCLAAYTLRCYGPEASAAAAPGLSRALHDLDPDVCRQAALTLGFQGPPGKAALPLLIEMLKEKPTTTRELLSFTRMDAAIAVGRIGPAAEAAVPALAGALQDLRPWVRGQAALALGQIGPAGKAALPDLRRVLKDREREVRACAAIALWRLERRAKELLPVLIEALQGKDKEDPRRVEAWTVREIVDALGEIGREAEGAAAALVPLLKEEKEDISRAAAAALKRVDPEAAKRAGVR